MPDTRRIAGPENTRSPYDFVTETAEAVTSADGKRKDGRKVTDHRPIYLKTSLLSEAKGSAFVEYGQTKVVCAVYGPREVARREDFSIQGQITCDVKFAPFSCRVRRQHTQDRQEKDFSAQLLEAVEPAVRLDTFPKSQVDIYVTVLENDGGVLSAAITCACMALADAGIELFDLVVGCTAKIHGETILTDPSGTEGDLKMVASRQRPGGEVTVAFMPSLNQVPAICFQGKAGLDLVRQAIQQCKDACHKMYPVMQETLVRAFRNRTKAA